MTRDLHMRIGPRQFFLSCANALIVLAFVASCSAPAAAPTAAPAAAPTAAAAAAKPTTAPAAAPTTAPAAATKPTVAPAAATGQPVELKWLQWWVTEWGADTHHQLIADFEAAHPNIKVTVTDVPWPDMPPK